MRCPFPSDTVAGLICQWPPPHPVWQYASSIVSLAVIILCAMVLLIRLIVLAARYDYHTDLAALRSFTSRVLGPLVRQSDVPLLDRIARVMSRAEKDEVYRRSLAMTVLFILALLGIPFCILQYIFHARVLARIVWAALTLLGIIPALVLSAIQFSSEKRPKG